MSDDNKDDLKRITDNELLPFLSEIAKLDLCEGADIFDHPCSVAIRRIEELKLLVKEYRDGI